MLKPTVAWRQERIIHAFNVAKRVLGIGYNVPIVFENMLDGWIAAYCFANRHVKFNLKRLTDEDENHLIFVAIHELQHARQHFEGKLKSLVDSSGSYLIWYDGTRCSGDNIVYMSHYDLPNYNELPWEKEANTIADLYYDIVKGML